MTELPNNAQWYMILPLESISLIKALWLYVCKYVYFCMYVCVCIFLFFLSIYLEQYGDNQSNLSLCLVPHQHAQP